MHLVQARAATNNRQQRQIRLRRRAQVPTGLQSPDCELLGLGLLVVQLCEQGLFDVPREHTKDREFPARDSLISFTANKRNHADVDARPQVPVPQLVREPCDMPYSLIVACRREPLQSSRGSRSMQ